MDTASKPWEGEVYQPIVRDMETSAASFSLSTPQSSSKPELIAADTPSCGGTLAFWFRLVTQSYECINKYTLLPGAPTAPPDAAALLTV